MKRSALITAVNVMQMLLGLLYTGLTIYLLVLTRSREILAEPDASDTLYGLRIGALVLGVPSLLTLIGVGGLWKRRLWGWVLSLATDVGVLAVLVYDLIDENSREGDEIALAAGFVVPVVLLLLPRVRTFYWNTTPGKEVSS